MMLYKNKKSIVRSSDGDTDFLDIVAGVFQVNTLAPYMFIISLNHELQTIIDLIKENSFVLKKTRSRRYSAENITDSDFAEDQGLLTNTPAHTGSLLHRLE